MDSRKSSSQQFAQFPNVIRDARFHCRGNADRAVNTAKVVIGEVQAVSRPKIIPLLRESIGEPRKAAHLHSDREVLAFHMRRANPFRIGIAHDWDSLRVGNIGGTVPVFFAGLCVDFDQLRKVATVAKRGGDRRDVRHKAISADLKMLIGSGKTQAFDESVRGGLITAAQGKVQNQLAVALDCDKAILIADGFIVGLPSPSHSPKFRHTVRPSPERSQSSFL